MIAKPASDAFASITDKLSVYVGEDHVGYLYNEHPLTFSYHESWLMHQGAQPLHRTIPLQPGKISSPYVHAFFENLLPEGDQRKIISLRYHVSTVFGMLATVGGDTAGAVILLEPDTAPQPPRYQKTTWDDIDKLIHASGTFATDDETQAAEETLAPVRISISGAQFKLLLSIDKEGQPLRPLGATPSTHILKPDMMRSDLKLFATAVNEALVMRAARLCELPTAQVRYQPRVKACLIERYDRVATTDGTLKRLWQADFCQLAGKPSTIKYEADGGPSFKECFDLLKENTVRPAIDQRNLLRWLFFNLYVGNHDSHAKNLSILSTAEGLRLAPFYDMMSTRVYTGLGPHFAFRIGGEFMPGKLTRTHLEDFAGSLGVAPRFVLKIAGDMADMVTAAIPKAVEELMPELAHNEAVLATRIQDTILSNAKRMRNRFM